MNQNGNATYLSVSFMSVAPDGKYIVRADSGIIGFVVPYRGQGVPEEGKHLQVQVSAYSRPDGKGNRKFFGEVRPPRELTRKLQGAYLNCEVVGTGDHGDPKVRAYGNGTNMYGFLQGHPQDIEEGSRIKVLVTDVKKKAGVPSSFVGKFSRSLEPQGIREAVGV